MDGLTNEIVHSTIQKNLGYGIWSCRLVLYLSLHFANAVLTIRIEAIAEVKNRNLFDFVPIRGVAHSVVEDVKFLKSSPLIPRAMEVTGWIYDVATGSTSRVV